ncbi:beta-1,4-galactosyltransferase 3-like [Hyalella azteca]|uniref:Beta-1,4-galactosyltransferase 3-like n=1 Tax=Hyalella azteca TaxID=294128 RepID=A0A8B7NAR8_HYAAZ|nr:beta-1,4-galactosyltransferase 3-like [Hyalella azteca]
MRGETFLKANGYSNMYWGGGGENDDLGYRLALSGQRVVRPPPSVARYATIPHTKRATLTSKVQPSPRGYRMDGLNTLQYRLLGRSVHRLYTRLQLDVGYPPEGTVSSAVQ